MLALTGLVTKVSARGRTATAGTAARSQAAAPAINLRSEPRAIARRDQSL